MSLSLTGFSHKGVFALKKAAFREALTRTLPIFCSYLFIGAAYAILMSNAGYPWYVSLLTSATVYTGAFQFMLVSLLSGGAGLGVIVVTALFMNSRQTFYSLTFLDDFRRMGRRMPFMVFSMTDETYAVNCSLPAAINDRSDVMFFSAVLSYLYWLLGTLVGGVLGQIIPWDLEGIDFCMTALFVVILVDQWEHLRDKTPIVLGGGIALVCLLAVGSRRFMLPALLLTSAALLLKGKEADAK